MTTSSQLRLDSLPQSLVKKTAKELDGSQISPDRLPLKGMFTIAFTSRTGSSHLCRTIETRYQVDNMGETMNPGRIAGVQKRRGFSTNAEAVEFLINRNSPAGWHAFKAGGKAIMASEQLGLMDAHIDRTHFAFLQRRNILAQALSTFKAKKTGQVHSSQEAQSEVSEDDYDYDRIARHVTVILRANKSLHSYLEASERPYGYLEYERFEAGDWSHVETMLDGMGMPRRESPPEGEGRALKKLDRSITQIWEERFRKEIKEPEQAVLDTYEATFVVPHLDKL